MELRRKAFVIAPSLESFSFEAIRADRIDRKTIDGILLTRSELEDGLAGAEAALKGFTRAVEGELSLLGVEEAFDLAAAFREVFVGPQGAGDP